MLWAVHIDNNVLQWPWEAGGFATAVVLLVFGAWRLTEEEIPRIALLTAAFFVASQIHVRVPPGSVHLLLNGLVGIILGRRAIPAIFVGLMLQTLLLGHGGVTALGVNACVLTIPALFSWLLFRALNRLPGLTQPIVRAVLVAASCALWFVSAVLAVTLLFLGPASDPGMVAAYALAVLGNPLTLIGAAAFGGIAAWLERWLENAPEFPLGLLVGEIAVLLTVTLNVGVLIAGGQGFGATPPLLLLMLHVPIAAIEGVVLGFAVGFLAKVKPELLGIARMRNEPEA
jgi:cobalt/nickel transport system permease protein